MALSEIYILSETYNVLVAKSYRPDIAINSVAEFAKVILEGSTLIREPVCTIKGVKFYYIRRQKLFFLATSCHDVCPVTAIEILSRIYQICKDFCGTVNEGIIKLNYVLIHELLDDVIDYGYIQTLSTEKIKPYVFSDPVVPRSSESRVPGLFGVEHKQHSSPNKPVIRSKTDTEDRKNEVYVDVIERISAIFDQNGVLTRCSVRGEVNMKSFLVSGSQIMMSLSDTVCLKKSHGVKGYGNTIYVEDVKFHDNVNSEELDQHKILKVSPPSGEFNVMSYSVKDDLLNGCPFRLKHYCKTNQESKDIDFGMKLSCDILPSCHAINVSVRIPVPKCTTSVSQELGGEGQSAKFVPEENMLLWKLKKISGRTEATAHFHLIEGNRAETSQQQLGPAVLDFEISGYLSSNLQIKQLKVVDSDKACPIARWVRYITTPESYVFRLQ